MRPFRAACQAIRWRWPRGICAALANGVVGALFGGVNQAYRIADRSGLAVMRWYVRRRVGGALTNPEAVKALVLGLAP